MKYAMLSLLALSFLVGHPCLALATEDAEEASLGFEDSAEAELEEELRWVQAESIIFSVSRREEPVFKTAAAAFVISHEDIRRSGATSIPEALRLAPGLHVAQINANQWAITSRNFNDRYSNKLLVLMDGRVIYNSVFSGVFWEMQDTMLEDVERIEVIRGPGATMWGANAVDGIINILTKKANDTQGGLATAGAGNEKVGFGSLRYGGQINKDIHYRGYLKHNQDDSASLANNDPVGDNWRSTQGGGRMDWSFSPKDTITLQGDLNRTDVMDPIQDYAVSSADFIPMNGFSDDIFVSGNILGRLEHKLEGDNSLVLQLYYDHASVEKGFWDTRAGVMKLKIDTVDLDFQHSLNPTKQQRLMWGAGFRYSKDGFSYGNQLTIFHTPSSRATRLYSAFVQDDITLIEDRLHFILGSKVEHNAYTDFEFQPSARLLWTPTSKTTAWTAISRAIRMPNRADRDFIPTVPVAPGMFVQYAKKEDSKSEVVVAYEMGLRHRFNATLEVDLSAFHNEFDSLRGNTFDSKKLPLLNYSFHNKAEATNRGVELAVDWKPLDRWQIKAYYTYLDTDFSNTAINDLIANRQYSLWSFHDVTDNLALAVGFRHVDDVATRSVDSYSSFNANITWKPTPKIDVSLVGKNLFDPSHQEFLGEYMPGVPVELDRSIFGKVTLKF